MNTLKLHPKVPKYVRIAEEFRERIASGELKPGDKLASFAEMRTQFGVGQGQLERAYSLLEQDQLIVRQSGNGTFVAQHSRRPVHNALGWVFPPFRVPYYAHLAEGIREVARREGQQVVLLHDAEPASCHRVDGILFHAEWGTQWTASLPSGMPHVTLMAPNGPHPSVVTDNYGGARQAVEHLISLGHRRIGYMVDLTPGVSWSDERLAGYRAALREGGIEPDPRWVRHLHDYGPFLRRGAFNMYYWLQADWHELGCSALLVQNDLAAIGAIGYLQKAGIRVPEDISVVGFDSTDECEIVRPNLSSVQVPLREIGVAGAELLLKLVRGEPVPSESIMLPTKLDVRDSASQLTI